MVIAFLYWSVVLLSCAYGSVYGGAPGRRITAIVVSGSLLTITGQHVGFTWNNPQIAVALIDGAALVAMIWVAMDSARYWPIWVAGFQLNAVATHAAALFAPHFAPRIYFAMASLWIVPALIFMVIGIYRDRRAGLMPDTSHRTKMPRCDGAWREPASP